MGNFKESAKDGIKKISGPVLNRIGCGVIGGLLVAYLLGHIDFNQYLQFVAIGFVLIIIGSAMEYITH